jgi:hypothetical protein
MGQYHSELTEDEHDMHVNDISTYHNHLEELNDSDKRNWFDKNFFPTETDFNRMSIEQKIEMITNTRDTYRSHVKAKIKEEDSALSKEERKSRETIKKNL